MVKERNKIIIIIALLAVVVFMNFKGGPLALVQQPYTCEQYDETSCIADSKCIWNSDCKQTANGGECSILTQEECTLFSQCYWNSQNCYVKSCNDIAIEQNCLAAGCSWENGLCSGTNSYDCIDCNLDICSNIPRCEGRVDCTSLLSEQCGIIGCQLGSCVNNAAGSCIFNNGNIANGDSIIAYQISSHPICFSEERICTDSILSGSYNYLSCSVEDLGDGWEYIETAEFDYGNVNKVKNDECWPPSGGHPNLPEYAGDDNWDTYSWGSYGPCNEEDYFYYTRQIPNNIDAIKWKIRTNSNYLIDIPRECIKAELQLRIGSGMGQNFQCYSTNWTTISSYGGSRSVYDEGIWIHTIQPQPVEQPSGGGGGGGGGGSGAGGTVTYLEQDVPTEPIEPSNNKSLLLIIGVAIVILFLRRNNEN